MGDRWDRFLYFGMVLVSFPIGMLHWSLVAGFWGVGFILLAFYGSAAEAKEHSLLREVDELKLKLKALAEKTDAGPLMLPITDGEPPEEEDED